MADNDVTPNPSPGTEDVTPEPTSGSSGEPAGEPKNTDAPESVPYSRFKEVNEAKKAAEEKLSQYGDVPPELVQTYSQFDQFLLSQPEVFQRVQELVSKGVSPEKAADQATDEAKAAGAEQPQGPSDTQKNNYGMYMADFEDLMDGEGIDKKYWDHVKAIVYNEAAKMNPHALNMYDRRLVKKAYEGCSELFNSIVQKDREGYVKDKTNDDAPPAGSGSGAPPRTDEKLDTRDKRTAAIANGMRAGR